LGKGWLEKGVGGIDKFVGKFRGENGDWVRELSVWENIWM
jgi:hypothetical protein